MRYSWIVKASVLLPVILMMLIACGTTKDIKSIEGDPERFYREGLTLFNKRNYSDALKKFEELKSTFPDSAPYTTWAELKVADCHFLSGSYVEAVAAYEEFKKVHPTNEEIPYVYYQIGMAHFNQMETLDRDQTPTRKALSTFEYLTANYPQGLFSEKAKEKMKVCKRRLVDQEIYVASYYYRNSKYLAAARRLESVLKEFPKIAGEDRTLYLLGRSYIKLEQPDPARSALVRLREEYPHSPYSTDAKAILEHGLRSGTAQAAPESAEHMNLSLFRFEEEGRKPLSLTEAIEGRKFPAPLPLEAAAKDVRKSPEPGRADSPAKKVADAADEAKRSAPADGKRAVRLPAEQDSPSGKSEPEKIRIALVPAEQERKGALLPERVGALPAPGDKTGALRSLGIIPDLERRKGDSSLPIDITSDRVESYTKNNLIVFRGNVTARQNDIVIYADSIEALVIEDGKGIEKVVADGHVKVQQGLRVGNCDKAVFYNLDKKVVLVGNPNLWDGDNMVSGEEIVFDIEQNRVDVKGGPGGRGKAKIQP
jgi:outer membrane protein assembly factor BamD